MSLIPLHEKRVRPLLDAVDRLREVLAGEPIKLPTIAITGDQSSGKSSVLESISGVNLPRGTNIVTRCPLVLRLVKLPNYESRPYAIIKSSEETNEGKRIDCLDDIGDEILRMTSKLAGDKSNVTNTPINLTVYNHDSPDLTLIDLPGITRNPVGDQPANIYELITNMISHYITPEETVVLNVIPASTDFSTSESIRMSKTVDKTGSRTIGVITKIDKCDKGIRNKLEGNGNDNLRLKLGYVAVRNRTQEEIDAKISFEEARRREREFFATHEELREMSPHFLGTDQLAVKLMNIQIERIRETLPNIQKRVSERFKEIEKELGGMPKHFSSAMECAQQFVLLRNKLIANLEKLWEGGDNSIANGDKKLHLAPRLQECYEQFMEELQKGASPFLDAKYATEVSEAIKETRGISLPNFLSDPSFKYLVNEEIKKFEFPTEALVDRCFELLGRAVVCFIRSSFQSFEKLEQVIQVILQNLLETTKNTVSQEVARCLKRETSTPFTMNKYYTDIIEKIRAEKKNREAVRDLKQMKINDQMVDLTHCCSNLPTEDQTIIEMQISIFAYWQVSFKRVVDLVPMIIRCELTAFIKERIEEETNDFLVNQEKLMAYMAQSIEMVEKRERLLASKKRLEEALKIFSKLVL